MKRVKQVLLGLFTVFVAIQFVRPARNQNEQVTPTDISNAYSIPKNVHTLFKNACYDCHSNNTSYPWYSNIQPIGWILAKDIENGKAKLNLSEFGSLSPRRQISRLQQIENQIKDGTMPLPAYQLLHENARLTKEDKELLFEWIEKTKDNIMLKITRKQTQ